MGDQVAIDERIRELVDARRPELERLVDQALARELEQLVAERLHARNGNGATRAAEPTAAPPATKLCRGCGLELDLAAYEPRRHLCRRCRRDQLTRAREQRRAAATPAGGEPPRRADTGG